MELFTHPDFDGHEQVVFSQNRADGLRAIIAIQDTRLGPALGGCRIWRYGDEGAALADVLRLAEAERIAPGAAADRLARARMDAGAAG